MGRRRLRFKNDVAEYKKYDGWMVKLLPKKRTAADVGLGQIFKSLQFIMSMKYVVSSIEVFLSEFLSPS